jgi:hypothetical protein
MKISETHKNFPCGAKGRLVIRDDAGEVIATIFTPVQKARRYCEANPDTQQGREFRDAMHRYAGTGPYAPTEEAAPPVAIPPMPSLTGMNPANTALISAQRKLVKLHEAALGSDPVAAVQAIKTSRGNKYLNTCDDYRQALLEHFGGAQ